MVNEYIPIAHLESAQSYNQTFLITYSSFRRSRNSGNPYALVTLQDVTGTIEGIITNINISDKLIIQPSKFLKFKIDVIDDRGKKKFYGSRETLQVVKGEPDNITDYIVCPNENIIRAYTDSIREYVDQVNDPDYRDFVNNAFQRVEIDQGLASSAYGTNGSLAYRGGLLVHTLETIKMSDNIRKQTIVDRHVNNSLIVTGCLFRNLGYMSTLSVDGGIVKPKNSWALIDFRHASFMLVNHLFINAESDFRRNFPEGKKLALQNICKSNDINEVLTVEGKIVLTANYMVDILYNTERCLRAANVGQDDWADDNLFIGHHRDVRSN